MVFNCSRRSVETTQSRGGKIITFGVSTKKIMIMKKSDMDYIYSVVCPICGSQPSYQITGFNQSGGITTFNQSTCGHSEVEKLIDEKHHEVLSRFHQPSQSVRFSLHPKNDPRNDEDEDTYQIPQR